MNVQISIIQGMLQIQNENRPARPFGAGVQVMAG
jgi:hypothetical protein